MIFIDFGTSYTKTIEWNCFKMSIFTHCFFIIWYIMSQNTSEITWPFKKLWTVKLFPFTKHIISMTSFLDEVCSTFLRDRPTPSGAKNQHKVCGGKKGTKKSCHTSGPTVTIIFEMFKVRYMQPLIKSECFWDKDNFLRYFVSTLLALCHIYKFLTVLDKIRLILKLFFMTQYHF